MSDQRTTVITIEVIDASDLQPLVNAFELEPDPPNGGRAPALLAIFFL